MVLIGSFALEFSALYNLLSSRQKTLSKKSFFAPFLLKCNQSILNVTYKIVSQLDEGLPIKQTAARAWKHLTVIKIQIKNFIVYLNVLADH